MGEATVSLSGRIFTGHRFVEAMAVENGRVVAVGSRRSVRRNRPTGADRMEVSTGLVIPGLIDPHMHLLSTTLVHEGVDLEGVRSVEELLARVRKWMDLHPEGPVLGRGWDQEKFEGGRYPSSVELDRLTLQRPVVLYRICSHAAVVNSKAIDQLGFTGKTPDPPGGRIGRGNDGGPNGLLFDNALEAVYPYLERSILDEPAGVRRTLTRALRLGLTTLASLGASSHEVQWAKQHRNVGAPSGRMRFYLDLRHIEKMRVTDGPDSDPLVRVVGVKAVLDGSLGARTAWLRHPYADSPNEIGLSLWPSPLLTEKLERAVRAGLRISLHAIGDAALASALDLLETEPTLRPVRIEHASLVPPDLLERLAVIGPDIVVQPQFVVSDTWMPERLGPERAGWTYRFRELKKRGLRLAASSDSPVEHLDPWLGLHSLTHRPVFRRTFESEAQHRSFSAREAFEMYTTAAGQCLGEPDLGNLEPGARADFAILSASTLESAITAGHSTIQSTWLGGSQVHPDVSGDREPGPSEA